jgi:hypothetical protein
MTTRKAMDQEAGAIAMLPASGPVVVQDEAISIVEFNHMLYGAVWQLRHRQVNAGEGLRMSTS